MGEGLLPASMPSRWTGSSLTAFLSNDSSEASIVAGLMPTLVGIDSADSAGFERECGAATTGALNTVGVGLALGLGVIK